MSEITQELSEVAQELVPEGAPPVRKVRRRLDPAAAKRRDLLIFKTVEIEKWNHQEVAKRFGLRRSRVSQIVQRVRRELAQAGGDDPQIESHLAQQRLQREMERLRLEFAVDAAARAIRRDDEKLLLQTNRRGQRNRGDEQEGWSETVTYDKPPNVQLLKTFLWATRELGEANERAIATNPIGEKLSQQQLFQAVVDVLSKWSQNAAARPDATSGQFQEMVAQFIRNLRSWIYRYRMGATAANAWPEPALPQRQPHAESSEASANPINLADSQINLGLTSPEANWSVASADAVGS